MPKHVKDPRRRIGEAVKYVSGIINDAEQFAVEIGVPRSEMLFIFLDQCLGRCECASAEDCTALKKFLAERKKAYQSDFSARMDAFWNHIRSDNRLDGPRKRPYWSKKRELGYPCPTPDVKITFEGGKLRQVYYLRSPVLDEIARSKRATNTTG